ncbi:MAG: SDR family NAD(P)-dependent oxidoreductase [Magnetococcales bacterium]|nr:SDR family NAD(P)-dependent oxidoreductase [Magnetococcales bacterium]
MTDPLQGKSALITGASRGVGRAIALALAREGMKVGLLARASGRLDRTAAAVNEAGGEGLALAADLTVAADVTRAAQTFTDHWGVPDYLINNAGIGARGFWSDLTLETEQAIMAVNYTAPVILIRRLLPGMLAAGRGHVININSIAGLYAAPYQSAYCASKAALLAYCDGLGYELEQSPVHISTLFPGPIETDFLANPNYESFRQAGDKVTPEFMAHKVLEVMANPRERLFIGPAWKHWAVKVTGLHPTFFRGLIEKKNTPPRRLGGAQD